MKHSLITAITLLTLFSTTLLANPVKGPLLTEYGPAFAIKNRDVELPKDFVYKAVFDIKSSPDDKSKHNRSIESAARFINMHAQNGVKIEQMKLALVFHGGSTKDTLSNKAYSKRYGMDNPNTKLLSQLKALGVEFYLCGQSAAFSGVAKEDLTKEVDLALSAMTMFVLLQDEGFRLIP